MKETFKSMIYMARRFKLATALNILGLVLAFATFYILMTQISYQATFNRFVKDYERIYRVECDYLYPEYGYSDNMCRPFAEALNRLKPQVESYSLVNSDKNTFTFKRKDADTTIKGKNDTINYDLTNGNNTVVSAIAGEALDGSIEWTDEDQEGYIIPKSIAIDYFGTPQCAGDSMTLLYFGEEYQMPVRGVYEDFPENSGFRNIIYINMRDLEAHTLNFSLKCYVKLNTADQDTAVFNRRLKQAILTEFDEDSIFVSETNAHDMPLINEALQNTRVRLTPLKDSYFESSTQTDGSKGYYAMFFFLFFGCIIVIVVGTINFLNCTLVESPMKIRNINTRLVLGAPRSQLRKRLITETIITSVFACLIALGLCALLSQLPKETLEKFLSSTNICLLSHWPLALSIIALSIGLGFVAGWYPAKFATSFQPAIALKASFGLTPKGVRLRNILVFFQLLVTMFMVIYIGILFMQRQFIFNSDYGFDKDRILTASLQEVDSLNRIKLCQELKELPDVEGFAFSNNRLASTDAQDLIRTDINGHPFKYRKLSIDADYLRVMGIDIVPGQGRDFQRSDSAVMIVNEIAHDSIEQLEVGMKVSAGFGDTNEDSATVIGVCKNIRYGTMRMTQNQPFAFIVDNNPYLNILNIRKSANANRNTFKNQAEKLIRKYCNNKDEKIDLIVPFDNNLYETYRYELLYFWQTSTISFICILLTLMGLFCLTMFETEYRRKEIGIRKVAGATTREIIKMLNKHYLLLIIISFAIAAPIAFLFGKMTLKYFADSTPIHWWIYPLALLLGGGITLGVVIYQSWRTARENPVNSIKTE